MIRRLTAAALVAVALAGCGGGEEETERELSPGTLRIGYVGDLDGRDRELVNAARVAVEELNASQGGIDEKLRVELVPADTAGSPRRAGEAARGLVRRGIRILVLPCASDEQRAVVRAVRRALSVATCNHDPALWLGYPRAWAVGMGSNRQAAALAGYLDDEGFRRVELLGRGPVLRYLEKTLGDRALKGGSGDADAVVYESAPAPAADEVPAIGTDAIEGQAPEGAVFTTYGYPEPGRETDEFYVRYRTLVGRRAQRSESALGYDAIRVIGAVVADAQSTEPALLVEVFREGFELRGALGPIGYAGGGARNPETEVVVVRIEDGRETLVERRDPDDVPAP